MTDAVGGSPLVVTVDVEGTPIGTADRLDAHRSPGTLHAAISLQVVTAGGLWLVQQRAHDKQVFGGRWANTCCTHPLPGEAALDTARRRVHEELCLDLGHIEHVGSFVYRAEDARSGLVEHEHDTVFVARVAGRPELAPDPVEIAEVAWVADAATLAESDDAAPWMATVVAMVTDAL